VSVRGRARGEASQRQPPTLPASTALSPQAWIRQVVACGLLVLLSARFPEHLAALARTAVETPDAALAALAMVGLDGFGMLCAVYLSHARLRGVRLLRCYPPQRLIPLSLHVLGLLWGVLTLSLQSGGSVR
jgi:hypothetical protein